MDNIQNMVGNSSIASFVYYLGLTVISVFIAGWFLSGRLRSICKENNGELEKRISDMEARLTKHETESVKTAAYEKDMKNVVEFIKEIKDDVKDGFTSVTTRIDNLSLLFTKDQFGSGKV
jgi:hypothetical protein